MNATAIYSKSGKGVQEASGKTSHLSRSDRAVLAAIDGRATLADVAQKVGKPFDPAFEKLIETLDKGGFIREVSAGAASPAVKLGGARPGAAKPAPSPMDAATDLDFTSALSLPKAKAPPPPPPPPLTADEKAKAERIAREQQEAFVKAREEAERKAAAERERVKAEAEAKMRAETESKLRAEADAKLKAEAEAKAKAAAEVKVKAAQEAAAKAAAEAKAKAEAEAKRVREEAERAREEAERARKEAEEKAERARKEAERARKEAEEKAERARKEAERARKEADEKAERARKEAEQKAERARKEAEEKAERARKEAEDKAERARKEAEEKARREQQELLRKLDEERKAREQAERKAQDEARRLEEERRKLEEERVSRRIQEERERVERRRFQQEEEERAAKRRPSDEEVQPFPELKLNEPAAPREPDPVAAGGGGGFSDTLLADLESFTTREEQNQKAKEEEERKEREAAAVRAREAEEQRVREDAERQEREELEREREEREQRKREEAERKASEEAELRERAERERQRVREEEERRKREADERAQKAKQEELVAAQSERGPNVFIEEAKARSRRERELAAKPRTAAQAGARRSLGKTIGIALVGLLAVAVGVAHVMPIDTADYERASTEALGRPVRIGSARLSLLTGLQLRLSDVRIGDNILIPEARGYPELSALLGPRKTFDRIEVDAARLDQAALGQALFAGIKADNFSVGRVMAKGLDLTGPLSLPKGLEFEAAYDRDGALRMAIVRGADALLARFSRSSQGFDVDISAASFTLPFAPEITLTKFSAKGVATPSGLTLSEWDGALLNGTVAGTANVRWGDNWAVDGVVTARNLYAAVFAPALVSDGKAEGSGKFQMRGAPGKLASSARLDGSFTVTRGVLGSIDLSRAIQTGGKFATGRTEFSEMNGQATYDRGAVALRNITLGAGQLNAGASADIAQNGALSGRIVADVRVASQTLRATLNLAGTVKEPQVRN